MLLFKRAYAKINLTLDVLGRRGDGYHEVDMVMQSIDLSDLVWLDKRPAGEVTIESTSAAIPVDERNLAVQAAHCFFEHTGIAAGVHIQLEKHIPIAAGLAGGSSDAAAVLRGLNELFGTGMSLEELSEVGARIGSDVPFCMYGGTAIARGRGEQLTRIPYLLPMFAVLIHPRLFVSTAEVYQGLRPDDFTDSPASAAMVSCLAEANGQGIAPLVRNALQRVTFDMYPELRALAEKVEAVTRHPVHMSGSGPTLFCLAVTSGQAQRMYNALRGIMKDVYICRFVGAEEVVGKTAAE
ncbi:4-diphosphocytidyl-2C-methyl-D-erythritol kinase [Alicyclobacillus tengchongensis]|nr:4-diphosphocytidyl-2C-methyl-D-erythritol kinase [Alicyclobacillus tengchongensis]